MLKQIQQVRLSIYKKLNLTNNLYYRKLIIFKNQLVPRQSYLNFYYMQYIWIILCCHMGKDRVDLVRVSFLVDLELMFNLMRNMQIVRKCKKQ